MADGGGTMIPLSITEVLAATAGKLLHGDVGMPFTGYTTDSRTVQPGNLYIPLIGERHDGNDFIADVLERGAAWSLVSDLSKIPLDENLDHKGLIFVHDTLEALQNLAAYVLQKSGVPVIAVTGSTGKTSTKEMLASVLGTQYKVLCNVGNLNNHIGLPLTCLRLEADHQLAVLEMGMNHAGELERLAEITQPVCGVITNIGLSHIENLGSREGILKAKLEITKFMTSEHTLIVNGDNDLLADLEQVKDCRVIKVGTEAGNNCRIEDIRLEGAQGSEFTCRWADKGLDLHCQLGLPGLHNIQNAALAVAVGVQFQISPENIQAGLMASKNTGMRLCFTETKGGITLINDAYNASPDSMKAALQVLMSVPGNRRMAVLSDMLELGQEAENGHRSVGEYAAAAGVDRLYATGPQSHWIAEAASEAGMAPDKVLYTDTKEALQERLKQDLSPGDVVLVKGSRGMKMERIVEALQEDC